MSANSRRSEGGPKVLRIGIVQRGKIIDERELKRRETVSIGSDERATFTVVSDAMPKKFDLFEYDGRTYYLRFEPTMDGRIQLDGQKVADFNRLRQQGQVTRKSGIEAIALTDSSRGKVEVGDVRVLFQFKAPAAAPVKPVLPADIRGTMLQNIDTQFAMIFVIVAVLQISLVTYARSLPYVEPTSIEQIDKQYQRMIMPDRVPEPPKPPETLPDEPQGEDQAKKAKKAPPKKKKKAPPKKSGKEASAKAKRDELKKQVAGKGLLKVLGANRSGGDSALSDVFDEGTGAIGDLGQAFDGIQGVDVASDGGAAGTRGGGSGEGVGIGDLKTEGGGRNVRAGVKREARVSGSAQVEAPAVDGELSQAAITRVLNRQKKALRDCYERALKRDRGLKGKIVISFEILENGRTANVRIDDRMGSSAVAKCIKGRVRYWRFPKPDGGSVFVDLPIVFQPSA